MTSPQAWPHCDEDVRQFINRLMEEMKNTLGDRLTGIYLHGSLAMGSYYRPKSDIDLIVVTESRLDPETAEALGLAIARQSAERPVFGNVELSAITAQTARHIPVPTPYEVHYSSSWHEKILNHEVDYSLERTDPDLASHLMYVVQRGVCLTGKPIAETFGQVKWDDFMESVLDDLNWIVEGEHLLETPFYGVLNICRVLQLSSEDRQTVHSKDEGGEWGLAHLPEAHRPLIRQSLAAYRSPAAVSSEEQRKTAGMAWDRARLLAFRDYARSQLSRTNR